MNVNADSLLTISLLTISTEDVRKASDTLGISLNEARLRLYKVRRKAVLEATLEGIQRLKAQPQITTVDAAVTALLSVAAVIQVMQADAKYT